MSGERSRAFWQLLAGRFRRISLTAFRRGYVREQQQRRRGKCRQCGKCCRLPFRCPFLSRDDLCVIYGLGRPAPCRKFPIDERDLRDVGGKCGYHFVGEEAGAEAS